MNILQHIHIKNKSLYLYNIKYDPDADDIYDVISDITIHPIGLNLICGPNICDPLFLKNDTFYYSILELLQKNGVL